MEDEDRNIAVPVEERQMLEGRHNNNPEPGESSDKNKMRPEGKADAAADPEKSSVVDADVDVDKAGENSEMTPEKLQELILERKAERKREAEEKGQEGLRRIAEMRSRHGIHPIEDLFPEEIWIKILRDKGLSPIDLYNLRQVHPVFQHLMEDTEIQDILLPLVFDSKMKMPLLGKFTQSPYSFDLKQILSIRSVSKSLRDSVDKFIAEHLLNSWRKSCGGSRLRFYWTPLQLFSENQAELSTKVSAFSSGPIAERPKRFFQRSLTIDFNPPRYLSQRNRQQILETFPFWFQNFKTIITELLEKVGDQILFFEVRFDSTEGIVDNDGGEPMPQVVDGLIREWLLHMPNLKWLGLWTRTQHLSFQQHLSMPKLDALEGVRFLGEMSPALQAVLIANPQVKYLTEAYCSLYVPYTHPAVLHLALEAVELEFHVLLQITNSNWKVKRMTLRINEPVALGTVFQYLEQNFVTLEQLSLDISGGRKVTIGKDFNYLRLPKLRNFEIKFGTLGNFTGDFYFFFALQFLLHCCNLESLTWTNYMNEADLLKIGFERLWLKQNERLIDFQGEGGVVHMNMRGSNGWDVFPKLRRIKANFRNYWYSINERRGLLSLDFRDEMENYARWGWTIEFP